MLNGVTKLIMTKVDVLSEFQQFKVCVGYDYDGQQVDFLPSSFDPEKLRPILHDFKGWHCDLAPFRTIGELPAELQAYVRMIEDFVGVHVEIISTGPDRVQTLFRD